MDLCFSHNSLKTTIFIRSGIFLVVIFLFSSKDVFFLPTPVPASAVSDIRTWPRFGFSEAMSRAGLLPSHSGIFAPTRVGLDLL